MIEIDGPWWFAGTILVVCAHVLYLRDWRRERREYMVWRERYNVIEQKRHVEFMRAIDRDNDSTLGWNLSSGGQRGQA